MVGFSELILVIKFGLELFSQTQISKMVLWILLNIVVSVAGVFASMEIYKWRHKKSEDVNEPQELIQSNEKVAKYLKENNFNESPLKSNPNESSQFTSKKDN